MGKNLLRSVKSSHRFHTELSTSYRNSCHEKNVPSNTRPILLTLQWEPRTMRRPGPPLPSPTDSFPVSVCWVGAIKAPEESGVDPTATPAGAASDLVRSLQRSLPAPQGSVQHPQLSENFRAKVSSQLQSQRGACRSGKGR